MQTVETCDNLSLLVQMQCRRSVRVRDVAAQATEDAFLVDTSVTVTTTAVICPTKMPTSVVSCKWSP